MNNKIILAIFVAFCFNVFSCQLDAAPVNDERYQQLQEEYRPIIEKTEAARELDNFFEDRISIGLLKSNNPFLRMILMWQCISFMRDATLLELQGEAPWMTNK